MELLVYNFALYGPGIFIYTYTYIYNINLCSIGITLTLYQDTEFLSRPYSTVFLSQAKKKSA